MPHTRQTVSFEVALEFLVSWRYRTNSRLYLPGSKSVLRFAHCWPVNECNRDFSAEISKLNDKHNLTTRLIKTQLPFRWSMLNRKSRSRSQRPSSSRFVWGTQNRTHHYKLYFFDEFQCNKFISILCSNTTLFPNVSVFQKQCILKKMSGRSRFLKFWQR